MDKFLFKAILIFSITSYSVFAQKTKNQFADLKLAGQILSNPNSWLNPSPQVSYCPSFMLPKDQWSGGCHILKTDARFWNEKTLQICFKHLREKIGGDNDPLNRDKILKALFKLPKHEQDFMGAILTTYGEVRSKNPEEAILVMQTLKNRVDTAKKRGCNNATLLDTAVQSWQFSVWNKSDPNWKKAVSTENEENSEPSDFNRLISIYKKWKTKNYKISSQDSKTFKTLTHFRTKNLADVPSWGTAKKSIKTIKVNNKELGSNKSSGAIHYFFKDIAWAFKYHPQRPKKQNEKSCY